MDGLDEITRAAPDAAQDAKRAALDEELAAQEVHLAYLRAGGAEKQAREEIMEEMAEESRQLLVEIRANMAGDVRPQTPRVYSEVDIMAPPHRLTLASMRQGTAQARLSGDFSLDGFSERPTMRLSDDAFQGELDLMDYGSQTARL